MAAVAGAGERAGTRPHASRGPPPGEAFGWGDTARARLADGSGGCATSCLRGTRRWFRRGGIRARFTVRRQRVPRPRWSWAGTGASGELPVVQPSVPCQEALPSAKGEACDTFHAPGVSCGDRRGPLPAPAAAAPATDGRRHPQGVATPPPLSPSAAFGRNQKGGWQNYIMLTRNPHGTRRIHPEWAQESRGWRKSCAISN